MLHDIPASEKSIADEGVSSFKNEDSIRHVTCTDWVYILDLTCHTCSQSHTYTQTSWNGNWHHISSSTTSSYSYCTPSPLSDPYNPGTDENPVKSRTPSKYFWKLCERLVKHIRKTFESYAKGVWNIFERRLKVMRKTCETYSKSVWKVCERCLKGRVRCNSKDVWKVVLGPTQCGRKNTKTPACLSNPSGFRPPFGWYSGGTGRIPPPPNGVLHTRRVILPQTPRY
jgi:hypothetical protein